jgi:hypothetical protein
LEATTNLGIFDDIVKAELCLQKAVSLYYASYNVCIRHTQIIVEVPAATLE